MFKKPIFKFFHHSVWKKTFPKSKNIVPINVILQKHPKSVFALMIISILFSIGCFFIYQNPHAKKQPSAMPITRPLSSSIAGLFSSLSAIKEILVLQEIVDVTLQKDSLNQTDSLLINQTIQKIHVLENMMLK